MAIRSSSFLRLLLCSWIGVSAIACSAAPEEGPAVSRKRKAPTTTNPANPEDPMEEEDPQNPGTNPQRNTDGGSSTEPGPERTDGGASGEAGAGGVDSTKGTGGAAGFSELKSAGGLSYQINAPAGSTKPRGLLVLLHGSTASNYKEFIPMMESVATQYDLIRVSVLAPNGKGWNEGQIASGAELLHKLVQEDIYPKYDIDKSKVLFSGQSSGGGFLSTHFVPLHAKDYRGGALFQCGAAPPAVTFAPDDATKKNFKLHFEITTGDPIWPESYAKSLTAYEGAMMSLTKDNTKPGGHCAFDQQQVIKDHIKVILGVP